MIALKVSRNGTEICIAGIGDLGVLHTHVTWVRRPAEREQLSLHIGGLHTPTEEHREWNVPDIAVGDTVTIQIIETDDITPHELTKIFPLPPRDNGGSNP